MGWRDGQMEFGGRANVIKTERDGKVIVCCGFADVVVDLVNARHHSLPVEALHPTDQGLVKSTVVRQKTEPVLREEG